MLINMIRPTPDISMSDINSFEALIGGVLPDEYRHFLLELNGGRPEQCAIDFDFNKQGVDDYIIGDFFSLNTDAADLEGFFDILMYDIPEKTIAIASTPDGNYFLLSIKDDSSYGAVFYKDHEIEFDEDEEIFSLDLNEVPKSMCKVSNGFNSFLQKLYDPNCPDHGME